MQTVVLDVGTQSHDSHWFGAIPNYRLESLTNIKILIWWKIKRIEHRIELVYRNIYAGQTKIFQEK